MIRRSLIGSLAAAAAMLAGGTAAQAAGHRTVAVLPAQYFSADAQSAANVTAGLTAELKKRGYHVDPAGRRGYSTHRNYPDRAIVRMGRAAHVDLIAYPRLMALGLPAARNPRKKMPIDPSAVLLLRILDTRTGKAIYARQIGHDFHGKPDSRGHYHLPPSEGAATAQQVLHQFSG